VTLGGEAQGSKDVTGEKCDSPRAPKRSSLPTSQEIRDVVLEFKPLTARDRCELVHIAVLTVISSRRWCKTLSPVTG
jgi:hypothetical protein